MKDTHNSLSLDSFSKNFLADYYVERNTQEIKELKTLLSIKDEPTKILFTGHRGSGKTSELRSLKSHLEDQSFITVFVSTIKDLNINDVRYTDILLAIIENIINHFYELKIKLDESLIQKLEKLLALVAGDVEIKETKTDSAGYGLGGFFVMISANIRKDHETKETLRSTTSSNIQELISVTNELLKSAKEKTDKNIIIMVDDLEKVSTKKQITEIFDGLNLLLNTLDCHFILTLPTSVIHSSEARPTSINYSKTVMLPLFEVKTADNQENPKAISEMKCIAEKRISGNCVPSEIIYKSAIYSGGLMHDFLRLLESSCLKGITNNKYKVSGDLLEESYRELMNEYVTSVDRRDLPILKKIHETKRTDMDENVKRLLFSLVVLEYIDKSRTIWYDVHPAVVSALKSEWGNA